MKQIYRGMQNGAEAIQTNFDELNNNNLQKDYTLSYRTGFKDYSSSQKISVVKTGKSVSISGACTNEVVVANSATAVIGVLPKECWPKVERSELCQASASSIYLLSIRTNGEITMSRHRAGADYSDCRAGSWISISAQFETN